MPDYASWDAYDLLEALELSGRLPDVDLIRACLDRREEITPGLLDMLSRGTLAHWESDDPRWYRDVHAGLLLIAFREPAALPVFDAILRDPEREDLVDEWFEPWLPEYGPKIVPMLVRLAQDEAARPPGRRSALRLLGVLGEQHPAERDRILPALRALLPADASVPAPEEDDRARWSWAVSALADLRDAESRDRVRALFRAGLLDETVTGGERECLEEMAEPFEAPDATAPRSDLVAFYETLGQWDQLSDEDLVDTLHETLVQAGADPATADTVRQEMLAALREVSDDEDEDVAAAVLERLSERLRAHGVHEDRLEEALQALTMDELDDPGDLPPWTDEPAAAIRDRDDYDRMTDAELLTALEWAGRLPAAGLVRAVFARGQALVPALLELLERELRDEDDARWEDDDPRWYRGVHAGLMLIALREPAALPLFERVLRDEAHEVDLEWFGEHLAAYGPAAVPMLLSVVADEEAYGWGRIMAAGNASRIASAHPEERARVLPALRAGLPSTPPAEASAADVERWTFLAYELGSLQDEESRAQIVELYRRGLVDASVIGDVDAYEQLVSGEAPEESAPLDFDPEGFYASLEREDEQDEFEGEEDEFEGEEDEFEGEAPFERETPKLGRNEKVTIRHPETGATETLKFKHAQKKLDEGWELLS